MRLQPSRQGRFWIVGLFLIGFNCAYFGFDRVVLRDPLRPLDAGFHLLILLIGLSLLD